MIYNKRGAGGFLATASEHKKRTATINRIDRTKATLQTNNSCFPILFRMLFQSSAILSAARNSGCAEQWSWWLPDADWPHTWLRAVIGWEGHGWHSVGQ